MIPSEVQVMVDEAKVELDAIATEPIPPDPAGPPPGFLTVEYADQERRRRFAAAREVLERLLQTIDERFGPAAKERAREHMAPYVAWLEAGAPPGREPRATGGGLSLRGRWERVAADAREGAGFAFREAVWALTAEPWSPRGWRILWTGLRIAGLAIYASALLRLDGALATIRRLVKR